MTLLVFIVLANSVGVLVGECLSIGRIRQVLAKDILELLHVLDISWIVL